MSNQDELRENFYQPTTANVCAETAFGENAYANVTLDAPTIRNVESHMQYAEDSRAATAYPGFFPKTEGPNLKPNKTE
jgi:hypothetical protein